jgi:predicted methyltransferase
MQHKARLRVFAQPLLLLLSIVAPALFAAAPETQGTFPGADPVINRPYQNPDYERWVQVFERPGREVFDRRQDIVRHLGLKPGMTVADIGAGTGLFTRLFAAQVGPEGRVIAVDISEEFTRNILRTARDQGLDNVEVVVNTQQSTGLDLGSIDLVFICDTYHHFEYPEAMMSSVYQALRPGGEVIIVDFRRRAGVNSPWIMDHVREGKEGVVQEMAQAGFRLIEDKDFMRSNYFLRFRQSAPTNH